MFRNFVTTDLGVVFCRPRKNLSRTTRLLKAFRAYCKLNSEFAHMMAVSPSSAFMTLKHLAPSTINHKKSASSGAAPLNETQGVAGMLSLSCIDKMKIFCAYKSTVRSCMNFLHEFALCRRGECHNANKKKAQKRHQTMHSC